MSDLQVLDISKIRSQSPSTTTQSNTTQQDLVVINPSSISNYEPEVLKTAEQQDLEVLDTSSIKIISSDVERPANKGFQTQRGFCVDLPYNKDMLNKLQAIVEKIDCDKTFFDQPFDVIDNVDELKKVMTEVLIRFDTSPDFYTKSDYGLLLTVLYKTLFYLYRVLNLSSDNDDVLIVDNSGEEGVVLRPQLGELDEKHESEDSNGNIQVTGTQYENNEKRIATIGDIRNYINNKLTWIEK